jgi:phosphohistidine phosphatase SixA
MTRLRNFSVPCFSRRQMLTLLASGALPMGAVAADDPAALLRQGGCVLMLRHAQTEPGIGDPPEFKLGVCGTQRNLSAAGKQSAVRMGQWFKARGLQPQAVLTSAWCRCVDTANLAFGKSQLWAPLNSVFGDRLPLPDQTAALRQALAQLPAGQFQVWVSHQTNVTALVGQFLGMGEGVILDRDAKVLARITFE